MSKLTTSQRFAVAQTLSEYNDNLTYAALQDRIVECADNADQDYSDDFLVWEPFEDMDGVTLCDTMDDLEYSYRQYAKEMTADLFKAIENGDPMTIAERMIALRAALGGE